MRQDIDVPQPRVSIGMPLFNAERYVRNALDSVLQQDYRDIEVIICDNASSDRTWEICQTYAEQDARVRLYRNEENKGAAYNYNRTVELACGELFKWAAYDDICASGFVRGCVDELDRVGPGTVLAYPRTVLIDDDGDEIGLYRDGMDLRSQRPHQRLVALAKNLSLCHPMYGVLRIEALRKTGLIRPYVSSDVVLLAELAMLGEFHEVQECHFYRRIHAGSSVQGTSSLTTAAQMLNPHHRGRTSRSKPRVGRRVAGALLTVDLPTRERVRCAAAFLAVWGARKAHIRGSHIKRRLQGKRVPAANRVSGRTPSVNFDRIEDRTGKA